MKAYVDSHAAKHGLQRLKYWTENRQRAYVPLTRELVFEARLTPQLAREAIREAQADIAQHSTPHTGIVEPLQYEESFDR